MHGYIQQSLFRLLGEGSFVWTEFSTNEPKEKPKIKRYRSISHKKSRQKKGTTMRQIRDGIDKEQNKWTAQGGHIRAQIPTP